MLPEGHLSSMSWGCTTWSHCKEGAGGLLLLLCPETQAFGFKMLEHEESTKQKVKALICRYCYEPKPSALLIVISDIIKVIIYPLFETGKMLAAPERLVNSSTVFIHARI